MILPEFKQRSTKFTLLALRARCAVAFVACVSLFPPNVLADEAELTTTRPSNLTLVTEGLFCGGQPAEQADFAALKALGIKTIVSVDGARPNLALAKSYGMRYVHIPLGYDGIDRPQAHALATVMRTCEQPIYMHCHHGHHRAPAAAAMACVVTQRLSIPDALQVMKRSGTSPDYIGLWDSVRQAQPAAPEESVVELVAVAQVDSMVEAMVQLDASLSELTNAGEQKQRGHAALQLEETFRELLRNHELEGKADFARRLTQAESLASKLRIAIQDKDQTQTRSLTKQLQANCRDCHAAHRN